MHARVPVQIIEQRVQENLQDLGFVAKTVIEPLQRPQVLLGKAVRAETNLGLSPKDGIHLYSHRQDRDVAC